MSGKATPAPARTRRLWAVRALELSPLVVLVLAATLWLAVPASSRGLAFSEALHEWSGVGSDLRSDPLEGALRRTLERRGKSDGDYVMVDAAVIGNERLSALTPQVVEALEESSAGRPTLSTDEALTAFEKSEDASVIALLLDTAPTSPVVYSAIENPLVLTPEQFKEIEQSGTAEALRRELVGDPSIDFEQLGSGEGGGLDGDRAQSHISALIDGHIYEILMVYPLTMSARASLPDLYDASDPAGARVTSAIKRAARTSGGAAVLVGPMDGRPELLRAPADLEPEDALKVGEALLDRQLSRFGGSDFTPRRIPDDIRDRLPGRPQWATLGIKSGVLPTAAGRGRALVLVSVSRKHPAIPLLDERLELRPWLRVRARLTAWLAPLSGALLALFVASLVVSPAAFAYERRTTAESEVLRERERLQEEARRKVMRRLEELSQRMERAATASQKSREEIGLVAADIEETVSELRALFGERSAEGSDHD